MRVRAGQSGGGNRNSSCSFCSDHWAAVTRKNSVFSLFSTVLQQSHWPAASRNAPHLTVCVALSEWVGGGAPGLCVCVLSGRTHTRTHFRSLLVYHLKAWYDDDLKNLHKRGWLFTFTFIICELIRSVHRSQNTTLQYNIYVTEPKCFCGQKSFSVDIVAL